MRELELSKLGPGHTAQRGLKQRGQFSVVEILRTMAELRRKSRRWLNLNSRSIHFNQR